MTPRSPARSILALVAVALLGCSSDAPRSGQDGGPSGPAPTQLPPPAAKVEPGGPSDAAVAAANQLGMDLYAKLRSAPGNLAYSPASIAVALGMTYAGARGETAAEMKRALHLPDDAEALHGGFATVLAAYQAEPDKGAPIIRVVNRLFGEKTLAFEPAFGALTTRRYGAPLDPCDFLGAAEAEQKRINDWVARETAGRIANLLPAGAVTGTTRLVLTNAVYFKGAWTNAFEKSATRPEAFKGAGGKTADVPMMHDVGRARFGKAEGVALLELGYQGGGFATLFVLPDDEGGLGALEERLSAAALRDWVAALTYEQVDIALPRFKVDPPATLRLKPLLAALGMPSAFDEARADFAGLAPVPGLHIDDVYHRAFVAVDEEGTEAAAATAVVVAGSASAAAPGPPKQVFRADHPFLYFVRDTKSGLVLFAGRVAMP
ncbi:MAG: serpin family protein [Myxococcales bacterium]|nr:serpin family protein [Myxococcales bacterium]